MKRKLCLVIAMVLVLAGCSEMNFISRYIPGQVERARQEANP